MKSGTFQDSNMADSSRRTHTTSICSTTSTESQTNRILSFHRRFTFGVGHVLNDLCSSMWFSYLLIYLHKVVEFSSQMSGALILVGQVSDGLATPFIGYESDRTACFPSYGRRKVWHLLGTVCVVLSFPFLFMKCLQCTEYTAPYAMFMYYCPLVVIFQFGWAATQIAHLSLIPDLTTCENERVGLNSIRYAFTVISSITVYGVTWVILNQDEGSTEITPADASKFRLLVLIIVGVGLPFSILFHAGTKEVTRYSNLVVTHSQHSARRRNRRPLTWKHWWKEPQFYLVGVLYMCTRLVVNISQVYLAMYITETLSLHKVYIASIPLVVFCSGLLATLAMKVMNKKVGRKTTYACGGAVVIGALVWFYFLTKHFAVWQVFCASALLGIGCSCVLITSLSVTADLIGRHTESGAFVYGVMGFTDKCSNGVVIMLIQHFHPVPGPIVCAACSYYYRGVLVFVPGASIVLALIVVAVLSRMKLGKLRFDTVQNPIEPAVESPSDERQSLLGDTESMTVSHDPTVANNNAVPELYGSTSPSINSTPG